MDDNELKQWFENHSDCYADTWLVDKDGNLKEGDVVIAMTANQFVRVFKSLKKRLDEEHDLKDKFKEYQ